jgi:hypothetical protein
MAGGTSPNLKPIATRARDAEMGGRGPSPAPSSQAASKSRGGGGGGEAPSDSPGMASDSSSPWRRFFRGGSRYPNSDGDSFGNSPRNLMGFSPKASSASQSHMSTPTKRKYGGGGGGSGSQGSGRDYGSGQITAYGNAGNRAAGAMMMSLAEELLTKKGLSLKDLAEDQEEYAETGDKVRAAGRGGHGRGGAAPRGRRSGRTRAGGRARAPARLLAQRALRRGRDRAACSGGKACEGRAQRATLQPAVPRRSPPCRWPSPRRSAR